MTPWNLLAAAALTVSGSFPLVLMVKATAVLGVVLTIVRAMRRARASRRHAVLSAGFVVLALLPATIVLLPPVGIDIATPALRPASPTTPGTPLAAPITRANDPGAANPVANGARTPPRSADASSALDTRFTQDRASMARLFFILWAGGVAVSLAPVAISLQRLRRLRIAGECWTEGRTRANDLAAELGVQRLVDVRVHDGVTTPMTCGWRAPVVLLPRDASSWPEEDLIRAFVHELEHVRRGDGPTQLFARIVCAAYWCHPSVWVAWRHLHLAADMASDDEVVVRNDARAFAMQLVTMAQTLTEGHTGVTPAMARRGGLSARVAALLNPRQRRGRVGARFALAILGGAAACCAGLSPLTASRLPAPTARTDRALIADSAPVSSLPHATAAGRPLAPARIPSMTPAVPVPLAQSPGPPNPASQTQPPRPPAADNLASVRFENTTIWKASTTAGGSFHTGSGNAFIANGVSIESLVAWAYGIGIVNASPARAHPWAIVDDLPVRMQPAMAERFDIRGKASFESREPEPGTLGALQYMVQDLLSTRFGLVAHWDARQRSVLVLHGMQGGLASLGPGIRQSPLACDAISSGAVARQTSTPSLFRMNDVLPVLNFSKASVRDIVSTIGKMAGIDVTFDGAYLDPRPYTLEMKDVTLEQALNLVTQANQLFYKVVNQRTILVANDTAQKRAQYNEPVVNVLAPRERPNSGRPATCDISIGSQGMDSPFLPSRVQSSVTGRGVSMRQLAAALSQALRYEVIDATSLPGLYDLDLRVGLTGGQSPNDALRQQLGLWLEEQRAPGEVLVIDRVMAPRLD